MATNRRGNVKLYLRVLIDVICIIIVAIPIGLFNFIGVPYKRGFFCDDESLKHPYHGNTIPTWLLGVVGIGLPMCCILVIEAFHVKKNNCLGIVSADPNEHSKTYVEKCYRIIIVFMFGGAVTQLLTEIGKYSIGRLRPHFFSICNVDMASVNCKNGYIVDFQCQGSAWATTYLLKDMRLSFPSGHASIALYCMLFLMAYLQARLTTPRTNLIRPMLQMVAFCLAFYTCLSRISDYKHHWSDVLAGALLGIVMASLVITFLCSFRLERKAVSRNYRSQHTSFSLRSSSKRDISVSTQSESTVDLSEDPINVVTLVK